MNAKTFLPALSQCIAHQKHFCVLLVLVAASGCIQPGSHSAIRTVPPAAEVISADQRISDLIEAANYSNEDREALKTGLTIPISVASAGDIAIASITPETIYIQVKKSRDDFRAGVRLALDVAESLNEQVTEFRKSKTFQSIAAADRDQVAAQLGEVIEQYRCKAFEALLERYDHSFTVPADVSRSIADTRYRNVLDLAIKTHLARSPLPGIIYYTLQTGDSLALIARLHHTSPEALLAANPGLNPSQMHVGQTIIIPRVLPVATAKNSLPISEPVLSSAQ